MKCSSCGAEIKEGAEFCVVCGKKLPKRKKCPNCGAEVLEDAMFCTNCGNKFEQETPDYAYYEEESSSILKWVAIILVVLFIGGGAYWYFYMMPQMNSSDSSTETTDTTQVISDAADANYEEEDSSEEEEDADAEDQEHIARDSSSILASKQVDSTPMSNAEWWEGDIAGEYGKSDIRMYINRETDEFWYYCTRYSSDNSIYLSVVENDGNHLVLLGTNKKGVDTGKFDGYLDGDSYSGTFYNLLADQAFNFTLKKQ